MTMVSEVKQRIEKKKAIAELSKRQARQHLIPFVEGTKNDYRVNWHHELTALYLEAVERGEIKRLMIWEPPRHGKSELSSIRFPAWYIGRHPDLHFIHCSYSAELASDFGRKVRNLSAEPIYNEIFPDAVMSEDSAAVSRWYTQKGGSYVAAGVRGPIGGKGAHILNIDDPYKDREQADSEIVRRSVWEWYTDVAVPRLSGNIPGPPGAIVITMTRWRKDDLAGSILARADEIGEKWAVLNLPAISDMDTIYRKEGEALWPASYPVDALVRIKNAIGSRAWAALYQQNPKDIEGSLFQRQWFEIVDVAPAEMMRVRFWDKASTEAKDGKDPDYTAGVGMGRIKEGIYYLYDVRRFRLPPMQNERIIKQMAVLDTRDTAIRIEEEPGSSGKDTTDHYRRIVLPEYRFDGVPSTGDKFLRMEPFAAQAEAGNVKMVRGAWNKDFLDEIELVPYGSHDDQADAASGAYNYLAQQAWMSPIGVMVPPPRRDYAGESYY